MSISLYASFLLIKKVKNFDTPHALEINIRMNYCHCFTFKFLLLNLYTSQGYVYQYTY